MEYLPSVLISLLTHTPTLLVLIAGIVLAVLFWSRAPRPALLLVIGLGVSLVLSVVGRAVMLILPVWLHQRGWEMARVGSLVAVVNVAWSLISAMGWALVIAAVFAGRAPAK